MQNKDPDTQTNMLVAIALSMAVLFVWTTFFMPEPPPKAPSEITKSDATGKAPSAPAATVGAAGIPDASRTEAAQNAGRIKIETEALKGSISLLGGRLDDLTMLRYRETIDKNSPPVTLLQPARTPDAYFVEHGWIGDGKTNVKLPGENAVWTADEDAKLTPSTPVVLTWDNGEGLTFKRTISVDQNYMFKIVDSIDNRTASAVSLFPYARVYRYGTPKIEGFFIQHEGLIGVLGEEGLQEIDYSELLEPGNDQKFTNVTGGWLGFTDKYWAVAVIPDQAVSYSANMTLAGQAVGGRKPSFQADYLVSPITITAGQTGSVTSRVFAGAKKSGVIENYDENLNIKQFDLIIDWGWFYFITKPLYNLMSALNEMLGNFGLAIIATTILVKLALFWPANQGYKSMARMKKLQPEIERLRERHKDDSQRQQKAMMELYQKEKINPLAGCWPILLQIPIFFALYKVVFISIDMRHAPFYGWIQDLSAPDPTSLFNLFGLLPFGVPDFLMIGIWPVLMGISMWVQMQLNPPQPDPTQQMIFNWMPVFFTFLLGTFASGLVIYWTINNILSIIQQYYIMRRQGADMHLMDNIKKSFAAVGKLLGRGRKDGEDSAKS